MAETLSKDPAHFCFKNIRLCKSSSEMNFSILVQNFPSFNSDMTYAFIFHVEILIPFTWVLCSLQSNNVTGKEPSDTDSQVILWGTHL